MGVASPETSAVQQSRWLSPAARSYLRLLKRCLLRELFPDGRYLGGDLSRVLEYSREMRENGLDWPTEALTMVGMKRLNSLEECCVAAIQDRVPGDFVETGTWRGGCSILMRATLEACGDGERQVWLFDSFEGLPKPDAATFPADSGDQYWTYSSYLGVSVEQVQDNFRKYELLDDRVRFVKGWFRDTVPVSNVGPIAVLRLDGDLYESTWVVLEHFYPKVSAGGFVVIDDYGAIPACKQAVDDYRQKHGIKSPMSVVDWTGVFWRKSSSEGQEAGVVRDVGQLEQKLEAAQIERAAAIAEMRSALAAREDLASAVKDELGAKVEALGQDLAAARAELEAERATRRGMEESKSWQLTRPLRRLMSVLRGPR